MIETPRGVRVTTRRESHTFSTAGGTMPAGLDNLKHIVVLMMENRSFDHMLGALMATNPQIDGVDGTQQNPDTTGTMVPVQPLAEFQSQLDPDPDHHFPGVDLQIFGGALPS